MSRRFGRVFCARSILNPSDRIRKESTGRGGQFVCPATASAAIVRWTSPCYLRTPVDTPVRLLVVDLDARHSTVTSDLADEEGIDVRTAVDAQGAISQCRLEYLDLVLINAGISRIVYNVAYRTDENAANFLKAASIDLGQIDFRAV